MNHDVSFREKFARSIIVDNTHMGRRASGIERITRELFSSEALAPLPSRMTPSPSGRAAMIFNQMIANPVRAAMHPRDVWVFPGYPPSPIFLFLTCIKVLYVHDLFLRTRWGDLNWPAKLYMALPFNLAVERFRYFFVNSLTTGRQLASVAPPGARIMPFRPPAHNVLGLMPTGAARPKSPNAPIVIGALGTVEPRKNLIAAAEIVGALSQKLNRRAELHIVGRPGWGKDYERLRLMPQVRLHGFVPDALMPELVAGWDAFLCSSHDEGLGLPLLEMQHAGLPIIAPNQEIFHEVLGSSGAYVQPDRPQEAAAVIGDLLGAPHWRASYADLAKRNIARWNQLAEEDRRNSIAFLSSLCREAASDRRADERSPHISG